MVQFMNDAVAREMKEQNVKLKADIATLTAERDGLKATVGKLRKTEDGKYITPEMEVWQLINRVDRSEPEIRPSGRLSLEGVMYCPESPAYSTEAAAKAVVVASA